jgi:hypothetical protein
LFLIISLFLSLTVDIYLNIGRMGITWSGGCERKMCVFVCLFDGFEHNDKSNKKHTKKNKSKSKEHSKTKQNKTKQNEKPLSSS